MTQNRTPLLEMQGVSKTFPGVMALNSVDLKIYPGEVHALIGENGAGKSTLIKILSGAQTADTGKIILRGKEITFHNPWESLDEGISTINQELMLIPKLSVAENILLGQVPYKNLGLVDWDNTHKRTNEILDMLGLKLDRMHSLRTSAWLNSKPQKSLKRFPAMLRLSLWMNRLHP
jgi:ABC-type sugar transport system ATPase subunit